MYVPIFSTFTIENIFPFSEESQTSCDDIWFTSRVMRRMASNLFITKKRPYVLEGRIDHQRAMQNNTPLFILNAFKVCYYLKAFSIFIN